MNISKRLQIIADMIPNNSNVIDVGCDHGLLSIYLAIEKHCTCLATDINEKALANAKTNLRKYKTDRVSVMVTDGINDISISSDDYIVIAGMGTQTIKHILTDKQLSNNLVISSNNQLYELRKFVTKLGYYIADEKFIVDHQKKYIIIKFTKGTRKYSDVDLTYGPITKNNKEYLIYCLEKLLEIKEEVKNSNLTVILKNAKEIKRVTKLIDKIN